MNKAAAVLTDPNYRRNGLFFIAAAAFCWSMGGIFIRITDMTPYQVTFWRSLSAALLLWALTGKLNRINFPVALVTLLHALTAFLYVMAISYTSVANAVFLQYTAPVYVLVFSYLILHESVTLKKVLPVVISVSGMVLFFMESLSPSGLAGILMAMASGFTLGIQNVLLKKYSHIKTIDCFIYAHFLLAGVSGVILIISGLAVQSPGFLSDTLSAKAQWESSFGSIRDVFLIILMGIVQLGMGIWFFNIGINRVSAAEATTTMMIEPLLAPIFVLLISGEAVSIYSVYGGILILTAVLYQSFSGRPK